MALSASLALFVGLNVVLDLLESSFENHSSFYFSESFLFSSFWWLFVPLILAQFYLSGTFHGKIWALVLSVGPSLVHLLVYPALIWVASAIFLNNTFAYRQTFEYALTRYGFILLIIYPAGFVICRMNEGRKASTGDTVVSAGDTPKKTAPVSKLVVSDGNMRVVIETKDILYISACSPYIYLHHTKKRYLHNGNLKSISTILDGEVFVRIHKSTIVNVTAVRSFRSRGNGDYDVIISNGPELRLSRNYAAAFKAKVRANHQDATL